MFSGFRSAEQNVTKMLQFYSSFADGPSKIHQKSVNIRVSGEKLCIFNTWHLEIRAFKINLKSEI